MTAFSVYYQICEKIQNEGWTKVSGGETAGPYAFSGDQWVSYMDVKAVANFVSPPTFHIRITT